MITHNTLIIGGGASGLMAAIIAGEQGKDVAIIEGEKRVGRKIMMTGNGRCNISNRCIKPPYINYHSFNDGFYKAVLDQLTVDDTIELFYRLGLPVIELKKGKLYPQNLQASSIVDIFRMNLEERDIPVYLESKVTNIEKKADHFLVTVNNPEYKTFKCEKLVVATGGLAAPASGSDGKILPVLKKLGHTITPQLPSIVQLKLDYDKLKAISGVRFDALVKVLVNNKEVRHDLDEVLFTDYGISGPAILQVSRNVSVALREKQKVEIIVDMFYEKSFDEMFAFLENHFYLFMNRTVNDSLNGLIHKKLIPIILRDAGIDNIHKTCDMLEYQEKHRICQILKGWRFTCNGTNDFVQAQTTIGGVNTVDVDDVTLESKLVKNLFFCGEVLDVDGDCGGFNLQWAWSSGYVVGKSV